MQETRIEKAVKQSGGMHAVYLVGNIPQGTLCSVLGDREFTAEFAVTTLTEEVSCRECLEWLHA